MLGSFHGGNESRRLRQNLAQLPVLDFQPALGFAQLVDVEVGAEPLPGAAGRYRILQGFGHALAHKPAVLPVVAAQAHLVVPRGAGGKCGLVGLLRGSPVVGVHVLLPYLVKVLRRIRARVSVPLGAEVLHVPFLVADEGDGRQIFGDVPQALVRGLGFGHHGVAALAGQHLFGHVEAVGQHSGAVGAAQRQVAKSAVTLVQQASGRVQQFRPLFVAEVGLAAVTHLVQQLSVALRSYFGQALGHAAAHSGTCPHVFAGLGRKKSERVVRPLHRGDGQR